LSVRKVASTGSLVQKRAVERENVHSAELRFIDRSRGAEIAGADNGYFGKLRARYRLNGIGRSDCQNSEPMQSEFVCSICPLGVHDAVAGRERQQTK